MEAAIYGSAEIAKVLADAGANLRLQGKLGYTASPMRMPNLDFLSEREYTALSIAAHGGFTVITEVLAILCGSPFTASLKFRRFLQMWASTLTFRPLYSGLVVGKHRSFSSTSLDIRELITLFLADQHCNYYSAPLPQARGMLKLEINHHWKMKASRVCTI
jgi:hypothetical protein